MNHTLQELTEQVTKWIEVYFPAICAGLMAAAISILMDIRAGEPPKRTATGGIICGLVVTGCYSFAIFLGMPPEAGIFFGAYVGFRGADNIKETFVSIGKTIRERKLGGASNANKQ
ncbi:phage holin family protein [Enterobacter sp. ASE]|uniref:phage holin family protein n=1 Tax=Enterobacter sp. ASE TaxID=2905968 RepID=UPI0022B93812|nr:phage holin family protein [Enterobacter sp. ASE]